MKRILSLIVALLPLFAWAQNDRQITEDEDPPQHILFEGIEVKGDIYEFSKVLQHNGYKLLSRDNNQREFVFKGTVCGLSQKFKVSFTKKTKTVYRIMLQPQNVPLEEYVSKLCERYGPTYDTISRGLQWTLPTGAVMLATPDGYDPTLVIMDAQGVERFKDEDNRMGY
jgi:hypothetical protein